MTDLLKREDIDRIRTVINALKDGDADLLRSTIDNTDFPIDDLMELKRDVVSHYGGEIQDPPEGFERHISVYPTDEPNFYRLDVPMFCNGEQSIYYLYLSILMSSGRCKIELRDFRVP